MSRQFIHFVVLIIFSLNATAQCDYNGNQAVVCPSFSFQPSGLPLSCTIVSSCYGLNSGYLVLSVPDTIILDVIENDTFLASNYGGCVGVLPICFDLPAIQNLVDIVIDNNFCCNALNTENPGLCDSLRANFSSGSDIQNLNDMIDFFRAFNMEDLTPRFMSNTLNEINDNIFLISLVCTGVTSIGYCSDPVDFTSENIDLFDINPDVCPFEDCIDTIAIKPIFLSTYPHQSTLQAIDLISAEGVMSTDHIFKSENDVILNPEFAVLEGAVLEILIEDCITSLAEDDSKN